MTVDILKTSTLVLNDEGLNTIQYNTIIGIMQISQFRKCVGRGTILAARMAPPMLDWPSLFVLPYLPYKMKASKKMSSFAAIVAQ